VKLSLPALAALTIFAFAQSASAAVVTSLSDDFTSNGQTAMLNWTGDSVFVPIPASPTAGQPSVDLVTPGTYPFLVPNSFNAPLAIQGLNAVDLDGSEFTGTTFTPAGQLQSKDQLAAGTYLVSFYLAGNLRGAGPNTTTVTLGGQTITLTPDPIPNDQLYTLYQLVFTTAVDSNLVFTDASSADLMGTLLADVNVTAAPEASTWAMMILGFLGIGFMAYRRKAKSGFRFA